MDKLPDSLDQWNSLISDSVETSDPIQSNFKITRVHFLLSRALADAVGAEAGANFHSWAVWGSRKAGITIRQEDKDQASRDATIVAGMVGGLVGIGAGWFCAAVSQWPLGISIAVWVIVGVVTGGYCGFLLAGYTRREASRLILEGNRIVLDDIGRETARYLRFVAEAQSNAVDFDKFLEKFGKGPTDQNGQDLLRQAFQQYETARQSDDPKVMHECNYFANCLAVLHEHIRLQPYISKSLPFLIRKCVTQRLMTYSVGEKLLSVHDDVPPLDFVAFPETLALIDSPPLEEFLNGTDGWDPGKGTLQNTRAKDWTKIRERMGYIVNLFRTRHLDDNVVAPPYSASQLESIAAGGLPERPW